MAVVVVRRDPYGREEKWVNHYSSSHAILLVGDGDFSFSLSLASAFGSASNIIATSLDSYDELIKKYKDASANLAILGMLGATLVHGVDATKMNSFPYFHTKRFHRIIYNFPHAGFYGKEDDPNLIMMHRNLVRGFFMNASKLLWPNGEIHVNHKVTSPFSLWKIEELATECSLVLTGLDNFRIQDYPGYNNKRGASTRCDEPFHLGECRTFKFRLRNAPSTTNVMPNVPRNLNLTRNFQVPVSYMQQQPVQFDRVSECRWIFGQYLNHVEETFGSVISYDDVRSCVWDAMSIGFETYMRAVPGRVESGYIGVLEQLRYLSNVRSQGLRNMLLQLDQNQL